MFILHSCTKSLITPIGTVVGGRVDPTDDHWGGRAIIRLNPDFPVEVVQGLEEFSHLLVVRHFHKASPNDVAQHPHARSPRNNPAWPPTGTFVHRHHRRPNQLAQSFPRLVKVDGLDLHVADLDAIDGTPIHDVAPYFQEMGPRGEVRGPSRPAEMLADYWRSRGLA
ncbi:MULTISPECIES: SAM-dependent methyltransferase [unclassified Streptomyces]|uniref:SAM-dependent methyltransferase n=1 Tax=unclassified Streptomyces TaxID=2593676 RepID=UPI003655EB24